MYRNTFVLISLLAVSAALVLGVNLGRKFSSQSSLPTPGTSQQTVSPTPASSTGPKLLAYTNKYCGISLSYPESLQKLEATSGAIFTNTGNPEESVVLACQKEITRPALPAEKIEPKLVVENNGASVSAKLYHDASPQDGTPIDELIFRHPTNGLDIFIAGLGTTFNQIINSLKVTTP